MLTTVQIRSAEPRRADPTILAEQHLLKGVGLPIPILDHAGMKWTTVATGRGHPDCNELDKLLRICMAEGAAVCPMKAPQGCLVEMLEPKSQGMLLAGVAKVGTKVEACVALTRSVLGE